jgi:hypothetical protein
LLLLLLPLAFASISTSTSCIYLSPNGIIHHHHSAAAADGIADHNFGHFWLTIQSQHFEDGHLVGADQQHCGQRIENL